MPAPSTISDFLEVVRKSRQINDSCLNAFLQKQPARATISPRKLAVQLIQAGILTAFQAEQFLQGKHKGFQIGVYRILDRLGMGGSGLVYLAEHEVIRKQVALKVLPAVCARDPHVLERFQREARAAAALDHPNVVQVYDFRQEGAISYIVMEYVEGPTLQQLLQRRKRLAVGAACEYARQTALALHHAHSLGLVHRDVKPANLIVDATGTVKLLDLGLARFEPEPAEETLTQKLNEHQVLGTADYLSPEQAINLHSVDGRADIYSLGATLYALLVGHPPFPGGSIAAKLMHHQATEPTPVDQLRPEVPAELSALVAKMLAKRREDRFDNANELALALLRWSALPSCQVLQPSSQTMLDIRRHLMADMLASPSSSHDRVRSQNPNTVMATEDDTISLTADLKTKSPQANRPSSTDTAESHPVVTMVETPRPALDNQRRGSLLVWLLAFFVALGVVLSAAIVVLLMR